MQKMVVRDVLQNGVTSVKIIKISFKSKLTLSSSYLLLEVFEIIIRSCKL